NQVFIPDVIDKIKITQKTGQEEYGESQDQIPRISQRIQSVPSVGPTADDRHQFIAHVAFINQEIGAGKESSHGSSQQQRTHNAVYNQKPLVSAFAQQIAQLGLELV